MAREIPFIFFDIGHTTRGRLTWQQIKNEYYYMMLEEINKHMIKWGKTYEWKLKKMERLEEICGKPVKLTRFQNFLANYLLF
jgi:hypothetical protein